MPEQNNIPKLVAHRGYSKCYPENTLIAFEAALQAGACAIELDVQLAADRVPVVIHDVELMRTTGQQGSVHHMTAADVSQILIAKHARFDSSYKDQTIPTLAAIVQLIKHWPNRDVYVEIKRASIRYFGTGATMDRVQEVLNPIADQCIIMSYDSQILEYARNKGFMRIGWVFEDWDDEHYATAHRLNPDYLITDADCVPGGRDSLWKGAWEWMVYTIDDPMRALQWGQRVSLVETNDIGGLLDNRELRSRACDDRL